MSFSTQFLKRAQKRSPFCLGIDPTPTLFQQWDLPYTPKGLYAFCHTLLEAAKDTLSLVKLQSAYFECFGPEGLSIAQDIIQAFRERDILVLLDAKRSDIASTSLAYAKAYLGPDSPYQCDALTALASLGFGALQPMLQHAADVKAGIFIVVHSSNPEGALYQQAKINAEDSIATDLAREITAFNLSCKKEAVGPIGAVIGATLKDPAVDKTLTLLEHSLILCPGIGHQGATLEELCQHYPKECHRMIPTSSRAILAKGPSKEALKETLYTHCQKAFCLYNP